MTFFCLTLGFIPFEANPNGSERDNPSKYFEAIQIQTPKTTKGMDPLQTTQNHQFKSETDSPPTQFCANIEFEFPVLLI